MYIPQYTGERAKGYDKKRETQPEWTREHNIVKLFLSEYMPKMGILDVPCGTGRFQSIYDDLGHFAIGRDISKDMVRIAREKGMNASTGSIFDLSDNERCNISVCIRLANWLTPNQLSLALKSISELSSVAIIIGIQLSDKRINVGGARTHINKFWGKLLEDLELKILDSRTVNASSKYRYEIFKLGW